MDLFDIFRLFYTKAAEYTYFPSVHGVFSETGHMLDTEQVTTNLRRLTQQHGGNWRALC